MLKTTVKVKSVAERNVKGVKSDARAADGKSDRDCIHRDCKKRLDEILASWR